MVGTVSPGRACAALGWRDFYCRLGEGRRCARHMRAVNLASKGRLWSQASLGAQQSVRFRERATGWTTAPQQTGMVGSVAPIACPSGGASRRWAARQAEGLDHASQKAFGDQRELDRNPRSCDDHGPDAVDNAAWNTLQRTQGAAG